MYFQLAVVVVLTKLAQCQQDVQPNRYNLPNELQSVNGSDQNGGCIRVIGGNTESRICTLNEGETSDLTDCVIPSLGRFQSGWAAGLFTVKNNARSFYIAFEVNRTVNFTKVELDLFNCPRWGIAAQYITVYEYPVDITDFIVDDARVLGSTTANSSCTSIVRVVIPLVLPQNPKPIYVIYFTFDNTITNIQWVHIAEVKFLEEEETQCPTPSSTVETSQQHGTTTTSTHEAVQSTLPQEAVQITLSQELVQPTLSHETEQSTLSQELVQHTLSQETVQPTLPQETVQPTLSQETVQPTLPQETVQPTLSRETVQPTLSRETVQLTLSHQTVQPTLSQETVQPTLSRETVQPTLSRETVQPTLSQPTLSRDTVQHTPGNTPFPDVSPVPQVAAVIITFVFILLIIALSGIVVLIVILVRARRKMLEVKDLQNTMMETVEYEEVQETQLSTPIEMKENEAYQQHSIKASVRVPPHTDDAAVYEEVRGGGRNQDVSFIMAENKAYGWHLQRGEAAVVSPSDEVEYEEI